MLKEFFVLDFSYENDPLPKVYIWAISEDGKRSLLVKDNFNPYFYVLPKAEENLKERILSLSNKNFRIIDVQEVNKPYLGRDTKFLKVICDTPSAIRYHRDAISKLDSVKGIYEADIRFSMRFSIDSEILPFTWIVADVEPTENMEFRVDNVYNVSSIKPKVREDTPELMFMGFELSIDSKYGFINPRRDPISSLCVNLNGREQRFDNDGVDDTKLIKDFVSFVKENDPDIIATRSSFQWRYIIERASFRNIRLDVSRKVGEEVSSGTYGHYSTPGRLNININKFLQNILRLGYVESHKDIYAYFGIPDSQGQCEYGGNLLGEIIKLGMGLSKQFGMPMDQLFSASMFSAIEWYLVRQSVGLGLIVPNKHDSVARVEPKSNITESVGGLFEDVNGFFFNFMPLEMLESYNISPETVEGGVETKGFLPSVLPSLYKQIESEARKNFGVRALKDLTTTLSNSVIEYFTWSGSRWFCPQCRKNLEKLILYEMKNKVETIKRKGASVLFARGNVILAKGIDEVENTIKIKYKRVIIGDDFFIGLDNDNVIDPLSRAFPYGDWSEVSKKVYVNIVDKLLKENPDLAIREARDEIKRIRRGEFEVKEMIIWKEIDRDLSVYRQPYPLFVVAAMKANKQGGSINRGDRIGYVVCEGARMQDKVEPFFMVKDKRRIDKEFYVEKQIIPLAMRVLKHVGVKEKDLREGGFDISNYFRR
ncbi:DNA polymerase [Sulfuracidifex tepidarius]|uniref:DNA-directed DNA polymerase n=1 Tax=Sulfuracidifex tepidarius TaxID=1294262 RepID=A0A510DWN2_9CREN|nr:DNA polymerase [Sulfuracidifex tepidarius]